jgi:penicillin-binding protein 1A
VFKVNKSDPAVRKLDVTLDQLPLVDGALICLDSKTGEVKAMVGGYDFSMRKFNNATQAERQTGSTFKPFIYAAAIERGLTPDSTVSAAPFVDPVTGWSPANYDGSAGGGAMPMRTALQHSLNVVAVRLLSIVGVDRGAEIVKRFGLPNPMKRVLPSALGATEEPLLDMVSAYSSFSNQGIRVEPHLIRNVTDPDGNEVWKWEVVSHKVISPYVAAQMQDMMRGAVTGGTAGSIQSNKELAKRMICGKTGTVNDFTDAWFIGYTPSYTAGVWIGYPGLKRTLGQGEAGSVAALPMWIQFMEKFLRDKPSDQFPKSPPADREIIARRAETEREMQKIAAEEAETLADDETSDKAKDAAKDDDDDDDDSHKKKDERSTRARESNREGIVTLPPRLRPMPEPEKKKKKDKNG